MKNRYYEMAIQLWWMVMFGIFLSIICISVANAASLKVCYKDVSSDTSDVNLYVGSTRTNSVFPGQTQLDGSICGTISPIPSVASRGVSQSYTLRAMNSLGEESVASNAITFRLPTVPGAPTLVSVGAFVP